jgi:hypothetical protein
MLAETHRQFDPTGRDLNLSGTLPSKLLSSRSNVPLGDEDLPEGLGQLPMESPMGGGDKLRSRLYLNEYIGGGHAQEEIKRSLGRLAQIK